MKTERRESMAERRPSFVHYSSSGEIDGSMIVPHLAGIEDPLPEETPEKVDVLIAGTGMVESVLAAALAWQGSNILHIDANEYYGDTSATLTVDQLRSWVIKVNSGEIPGYSDASITVSEKIGKGKQYASRDFGIDLTPKILFAKSDLLSILVKSRVHQYLEFQSLSTFHTYENDSFEKLTNSKQEIFTNQKLPLMTKHNLMRFIKFALTWRDKEEIWGPYADRSIVDFLLERFKLERPQVFELVFSLGLCLKRDTKVPEALQRIHRYLISYDVYGPFPALYSRYGGAGELSQGFCRSAAVAGTTYKLNERLSFYDPTTKVAVFEDGSKVSVSERVILSPSQAPRGGKHIPEQKHEIHRMTCIVEKSCEEWFSNGESAAVIVFPPGSLRTDNKYVVQTIILGSGSGCCPKGTCIWHLWTTEKDSMRAKVDLDAALEALEISIQRESSSVLADSDAIVQLTEDGQKTIVDTVKLGESFKDFTPSERLIQLMKFSFTQYTSVPPFDVVNSQLFDTEESSDGQDTKKFIVGASDNGVIYTTMPSSEISYDEVVTAAKVIYGKIVGSEDDFFDIDFEDEDEGDVPVDSTKTPDSTVAVTDDSEGAVTAIQSKGGKVSRSEISASSRGDVMDLD